MKKFVETLKIIEDNNESLGKKMVQKLLYLMERRGLNLDLNYKIHFFGPYSSKLDDALHTLKNWEVIDIDTSGATHTITVLDTELFEGQSLEDDEREIVDSVIYDFANMSALDLEAITTLDYVAKSMDTNDEITIINEVLKIKGSKFKESQLKDYFNVLKKYYYL